VNLIQELEIKKATLTTAILMLFSGGGFAQQSGSAVTIYGRTEMGYAHQSGRGSAGPESVLNFRLLLPSMLGFPGQEDLVV
jgi:hypothetical protein